jgi:hypothetical protein
MPEGPCKARYVGLSPVRFIVIVPLGSAVLLARSSAGGSSGEAGTAGMVSVKVPLKRRSLAWISEFPLLGISFGVLKKIIDP